ncbi:MAG TPA: hypothetical protein P5096_02500 [Patescibacteria group bacterium]|nr:hypothetical protein [Patescibacteria group bacterium]
MENNTDVLIVILSTGFVILIIFVCVALGAMIKIMLDIKKITEIAKKEADAISQVVDVVGNKAKSFVTNSFIIDKIVPAIMGIIAAGMSAKAGSDFYKKTNKQESNGSRKQESKKTKKQGKRSDIFSDDEID